MKTINTIDLDNVCGGADPREGVILNKLNRYYGSQGDVSLIGHPTFGAAHNGIESVNGKFDTNALWGGDVKRSFSGRFNERTNKFTGLRTKILSSE